MATKGFSVTYERLTPESIACGDAAERGHICQGETLRDALQYFCGYGCRVEADCHPLDAPRWFTAYETNSGTRDYYEKGAIEDRSLHLPDHITPSSRRRIARLIGCYGA